MIKTSILWNPHCRKPPNDRRIYSMNRSDDGPNLPHHSSQPLYSCVLTLFSEMAKPQHLSTSTCPFPKKTCHSSWQRFNLSQQFFLGGKQSVISPLNADRVLPEYIQISGKRISLALTQLRTCNRKVRCTKHDEKYVKRIKEAFPPRNGFFQSMPGQCGHDPQSRLTTTVRPQGNPMNTLAHCAIVIHWA